MVQHERIVFHVSPADLRFTQDSIEMSFQNNNLPDLNATCEKIAKKVFSEHKIPTMRVVNVNGIYYR